VLVHATPRQATAIVRAMKCVATGDGADTLTAADATAIEPMAGHIRPVIFSWHLGIELNPVAGKWTGALHPGKFWVAWERGAETMGDPFGAGWDFWAMAPAALDELQRRFRIPPLAPGDAATDDRPGFKPIE